MTILEDELRLALRAQAHALCIPEPPALERTVVEPDRRAGLRWLAVAACVALVVASVLALAQRRVGDPEPTPPVASVVIDTIAPVPPVTSVVVDTIAPVPPVTSVVSASTAPVVNGWVALVQSQASGGEKIYLARPGQDARLLEIDGPDTADAACPAWSPDGTRLLFLRSTSSADTTSGGAELVIVPIGVDGTAGEPTVMALDGFAALYGLALQPCGVWAPDGRWIALPGPGDVWVVDTQTGEIRRLPDLRPSDLEWRPGTDQLAIAGDMGANRSARTLSTPVTIYSVAADELGQLGSVAAAHLTWSPDGSSLAYEGGEDGPGQIRVVDADGANDRVLVADRGNVNHGIGPVWSPIGDRIAYQRICCASAERHEVVLVNIADGNETVIEPPPSDGPGENVRWYPFDVSWSPDGATLLYMAWRSGRPPARGEDSSSHVIAVPADAPHDVTVLARGGGGAVTQMWGRQPG